MKITLYGLLSLSLLANIAFAGAGIRVDAGKNYDIQNHINIHRTLYNMGKEFHIIPHIFTDAITFGTTPETYAKGQLAFTEKTGTYRIGNTTYLAINSSDVDDLRPYLYHAAESPVYQHQYTEFACTANENRSVCAFIDTGMRDLNIYSWDRNSQRMHLPDVKIGNAWYRVVFRETEEGDLKLEGYRELHPDEVYGKIYHATYSNGILSVPRLSYTNKHDDRWLTTTTLYYSTFINVGDLIFEVEKMSPIDD